MDWTCGCHRRRLAPLPQPQYIAGIVWPMDTFLLELPPVSWSNWYSEHMFRPSQLLLFKKKVSSWSSLYLQNSLRDAGFSAPACSFFSLWKAFWACDPSGPSNHCKVCIASWKLLYNIISIWRLILEIKLTMEHTNVMKIVF